MNCWEFKKCGREEGGARAAESGVCSAYPDHGQRCASVPGTHCTGKPSGNEPSRLADCADCAFYRSPHHEKPDAARAGSSDAPRGTRCSHLSNCALYPKLRLPSTREFWIEKYCHADPKICARFRLNIEGKPVPHALLPSGQVLKISR